MDGIAVHGSSGQVSIDVIEAIADETGSDPLRMEPPLYEVVDTDALDAIYESGAATVEFEYDGHSVVIADDGTVTVDGEGGV
ncbi:HalOD1 output domain-containing protein [Halosimplex halophilum]|uniref:HalOD1 output domain-containing protein n=1 Tax=Halosimplex halophilum TaxID=2559572 RepID=UPI00107FA15C|nr:HalOD1 output domain-containing protein [Halosimplex halophilum]